MGTLTFGDSGQYELVDEGDGELEIRDTDSGNVVLIVDGVLQHEDTNGSDNPNAHHTEPTAGTGITDEGTNEFGIDEDSIGASELKDDSVSSDAIEVINDLDIGGEINEGSVL
jgi:hypothetical protein